MLKYIPFSKDCTFQHYNVNNKGFFYLFFLIFAIQIQIVNNFKKINCLRIIRLCEIIKKSYCVCIQGKLLFPILHPQSNYN